MFSRGEYRKRITIEKPVRVPNELGEKEISWQPVADIWASVRPLSAKEITYVRQAQLQTTHEAKTRWLPGLTGDCRLTWTEPDGTQRILNITGIIDSEERHIELTISCVEQNHG